MMRITMPALVVALATAGGCAQMNAPPAARSDDAKPPASAPAVQPSGPLAPLAWLEGCWRGSVNRREFREHWLPLRGDLMLGVSHTVIEGKTQDYEFLRLEPRADGLWYVVLQPGQPETAFKLGDVATEKDSGDTTFSFDNPGEGFPHRIRYRRGSEGWLYAQVEGSVSGAARNVIYPMRRVDCQSGEFIRK